MKINGSQEFLTFGNFTKFLSLLFTTKLLTKYKRKVAKENPQIVFGDKYLANHRVKYL